MANRIKDKSTNNDLKTNHKIKIKLYEPYYKLEMNSGAPQGKEVPDPHVTS